MNDSLLGASQRRRSILRGSLGLVGVGLMGWPAARSFEAFALRQSDGEDDDDSGRGRGRGRGGRNGGDEDEAAVSVAAAPAGSIEVRIVSDDAGGFVPGELTVDLGQTISFVNAHDDEHTATGSGFDTGIIAPGGVATVTLDAPGRFAYACQIHPEMTGTVTVLDASGGTPVAQSAAPAASGETVSIVNLSFAPAELTVPVGATVTWSNDDAVPHTVTAEDGTFDSGIFDPGGTFTWTFDSPGDFAYLCQLHPQMRGTIVVTDGAAAPAAVDAAAAATPEPGSSLDVAGTWLVQISPSQQSRLGELSGLLQMQDGGTAEAQFVPGAGAAVAELTPESGSGTWELADGEHHLSLVLLVTESGRYAGLLWIDATVTHDQPTNSLSGQINFALTDGENNPVEAGTGELTARRILASAAASLDTISG